MSNTQTEKSEKYGKYCIKYQKKEKKIIMKDKKRLIFGIRQIRVNADRDKDRWNTKNPQF